MIPIKFKEANRCLGKPVNMTEECNPLWVYSDEQQCISCWKLTFKEIISLIFYKKIWLSIMSGSSQPPVWIDVTETVFEKIEESEKR